MLQKIKNEIIEYKKPIIIGALVGLGATALAFQFNLVTLQAIYTPSQFSMFNDIISTTTQVFTATKNQIYAGMLILSAIAGYIISKTGVFKK